MNIVNLIHIGDEVKNWEDLSTEEKRRIATALNRQALMNVGYRPVEDKTA